MHGVTSLEGQLSSARTSNLFTHVFTRVLSRVYCAGLPWTNSHSVAATRLVWTAVILNNSETSGPLLNGRVLKMYSLEVYIKSFGGEKGGSSEPPRTPPAYGPDYNCWYSHFTYCTNSNKTLANHIWVQKWHILLVCWLQTQWVFSPWSWNFL